METRNSASATLVSLAIAAWVTGCGGAGAPGRTSTIRRDVTPSTAPSASVVAPVDQGREVSKRIVASVGGSVIAADGAVLTIPSGALAEDTTITINVPTAQTG